MKIIRNYAPKVLAATLFVCLFCFNPADASILRMLSKKDLIHNSDSIVLGTVIDEYSQYDPTGRFIVTYTKIRILQDVKGAEGTSGEVIVKNFGGKVGSREMIVHGGAKFLNGEKTLLFLKNGRSGFKSILGLSQGKFNVIKNIISGKEQAVNPLDPELKFVNSNYKLSDDAGLDKKAGPVDLSDFLDEIKKELSN
jgi:hypothetical protein